MEKGRKISDVRFCNLRNKTEKNNQTESIIMYIVQNAGNDKRQKNNFIGKTKTTVFKLRPMK